MQASLRATLWPAKCRARWFWAGHERCQLGWSWGATPPEGWVQNGMSSGHKPPLRGAAEGKTCSVKQLCQLGWIQGGGKRRYTPIQWSWQLQAPWAQTGPLLSGKPGRVSECQTRLSSQQQGSEPCPTLLMTDRWERWLESKVWAHSMAGMSQSNNTSVQLHLSSVHLFNCWSLMHLRWLTRAKHKLPNAP